MPAGLHGEDMLKGKLVEDVSEKLDGYLKRDVRQAIDIIIEAMVEALKEEKRVEIRGFGSFSIRKRKARLAENPKTGQIMNIPQRKSVLFTMSKSLKETLVNSGK
jgi:nucleoid DNA-binding protein